MLSPQSISKEVNANNCKNGNKIQESKTQLQDLQIRIILMAIEIERLHQILNSKLDYQNQKAQDFEKKDLFQKEQLNEQLQANNQQKIEKNEFINKTIKENSQLDTNMQRSYQYANLEQQMKSQQLQNQQLQKEIQELRSQIKDGPSTRKKLYDLEQLYSQLLIEKNEELKQLTQYIPQTSFQDSQKELTELQQQNTYEQQENSEQTNLILKNKRLTKELKLLDLKLNLLINDNNQLREKLIEFQSQNTFQNTLENKNFIKKDGQESSTPKRQQQCQLFQTMNQLGNNKTIERIYSIKSNTPISWISNSQIPIHQQSYSQPQQNIRENQNIYQFDDLIKQILFLQNQKSQTIQSIKSQIFYLRKILELKQFEMFQLRNQKKQNIQLITSLNDHLINQQIFTSTHFKNYPYQNNVQYSYSLSPNKLHPQSYQYLQPSIRNLHPQYYQGIRTQKSFVSYQTIAQICPIFLQKPQLQCCYYQGMPKQQIYYPCSYSPIKKTIVKQNISNPYSIPDINLKQNASYYKPNQYFNEIFRINNNKQEDLSNINKLKKQEENTNKEVILSEFNINTTEFQIKSQNSLQNQNSQGSIKQNHNNEDDQIDEPQQNRKPVKKIIRSNDIGTFQQKPSDIPKEVQIFDKINLQNPLKQKSNLQVESEFNKRQEENIQQKVNLNLTQKQSKDFILLQQQSLNSHEQQFQQIYQRALNLLENLKDLFQIQSAESEINQQIRIQRNNKFNRTVNDNIDIPNKQKEHQGYKIEQTFSNLNQYGMINDLQQQITQLKNLFYQQQIQLSQFISEQDEIKNKQNTLLSQSSQTETEQNKEIIKIKQDHENININLTQKLQVQSQEITILQKQNDSLKQQILDFTKDIKNVQQELKFQHDQNQKTTQFAQILQSENDNNKNQIYKMQNRNKLLEQQIIEKDKLLFENQNNKIKNQTHDKESQTILKENQQMQIQFFQQDQIKIEIENFKKQLSFEQELTKQLYDSISVLQQQIQAQEQLIQIQKLNNQNQLEEIRNLSHEKTELSKQLKIVQDKYLEIQEQIQLIQNQKQQAIQQNPEPLQNSEIIQHLNFQLEDMKQHNQFLQNQLSSIQYNSEIQISAQSTVLSSKIALLEKQLSFEKQLKEQANKRIKLLEDDYQNQKNHYEQAQISELKQQFLQIPNQQELKLTKKDQDQSPSVDFMELNFKTDELNLQNQNYLKQIKDFEEKQKLQQDFEKKIINQTKLLQQYQQQVVILQQENNQYKNDVLQLRQGLQLDIQDFEGQQLDYINNLKNQIEELNSQNMKLREDINYLQSQLQFEQREKNIIAQNKTIQDGSIEQILEKNVYLQNQILQQQNYIDSLNKKIPQSNYTDNLLNQTEGFNHQRLWESQNLQKDHNQIISSLSQQNKILVEECQQLKIALQEITKEKDKLQRIINYQSQEQESCFQDLYQNRPIINNVKNEQQIQGQQINVFKQIDDLNNFITISLFEIGQLHKLNSQNEQLNQDLQNQIKNLKEQIIQNQQVKKIQIEEEKQNEFIIKLTQLVQILNQRIKDKIQLNSLISKIISKFNQLMVQISEITAQIQNKNYLLQRIENSNNLQQNYYPLKTENEQNYQELKTENYKLNQKANQYEQLLLQLQDEYYKQGSALQSITNQYQDIINQDEFQLFRITQLKQLNERINQQEKQIEVLLQQNSNLEKYIEKEKKNKSDEISKLNNIILENQEKLKNNDYINQENIKLQAEIFKIQQDQEKQRFLQDLTEEQKLIIKQNQDEQTQLKHEIQKLYQRLLQISNSQNLLKEEKEQESLRFEKEKRLIKENLEKIQNENELNKVLIVKLQKQIQDKKQDQKNQTENNFLEEIKKLQIQLEISQKQQRSIQDEKRIAQAQVYQQLEELANQQNTINLLRQELYKKEQIIGQLSQQKNIKSSFVQEVTDINDSKSSKPLDLKSKQLQNENTHLQQLLIDMESFYTHKIKMQEIQIEGLNDKLRDMLYEHSKQNPKADDVVINNFHQD
ncbi:unnamed protein product [Paramecium sonneborni]|uniref:Uncharacterized protein n=1 Tax=Paramecium sonneborni TaxID=65129 RepID=A0A8S1MUW7_9CILI|nr:unnamed protein product [Paramecium sonneborni]